MESANTGVNISLYFLIVNAQLKYKPMFAKLHSGFWYH